MPLDDRYLVDGAENGKDSLQIMLIDSDSIVRAANLNAKLLRFYVADIIILV